MNYEGLFHSNSLDAAVLFCTAGSSASGEDEENAFADSSSHLINASEWKWRIL